jgi:predicted nucleic acid-binding protein
MPFCVEDLSKHLKPKSGLYFFDTNVLLFVMGVTSGKPHEPVYIDFFNDVFMKTSQDVNCRIITTSLQISELFNRLLKLESSKAFTKSGYTKGEYGYYKDVFRKSADIKKLYEQFKSDFLAFQAAFEVVPCPVQKMEKILDFSPAKTDVNDHLYMALAEQHDATIVTHDSDLYKEGIHILTLNKELIKASRNFTITIPAEAPSYSLAKKA